MRMVREFIYRLPLEPVLSAGPASNARDRTLIDFVINSGDLYKISILCSPAELAVFDWL